MDSESDSESETSSSGIFKAIGIAVGAVVAIGASISLVGTVAQAQSYSRTEQQNARTCPNEFVDATQLDAQKGDLIEIKGDHYNHWAICVAENLIVHFVNLFNGSGKVDCEPLTDYAKSQKCRVNNLEEAAKSRNLTLNPCNEICVRAKSFVDRVFEYDWKNSNCEHFVTQCAFGEAFSEQANNACGKLFVSLAASIGSMSGQSSNQSTQSPNNLFKD